MATAMKHKARSRKTHHRTESMKVQTFVEMSRYNMARNMMRDDASIGAMIAGMLPKRKKEKA